MTEEEKNVNRVVVTDETGAVTRVKSDAEIVSENQKLEEAFRVTPKDGSEEEPQLDLDILKKLKERQETKEDEPMKATTKRDRSLYFGVIGLGQAGNRVAETFYGLGYEACVFNTATQDLEHIGLPDNRKVFLPFALGGAGKELDNGRAAVENNGQLILDSLNSTFSDSQEMLLLAVSGGGGTGSGGAEAMLGLLASLGKPIGVIYILPMESEDALSKHNSVVTLSKLAKMASTDQITTLIVVDNSKIELMYPGLSKGEFWTTANNAIVEPLHIFNHLSSMPTEYDSLDPMDYSRLFVGSGDCTIYGMLEIEDYMESTAIAEAIIANLADGLLASDFDLKQTRFGGFIVTASKEILKKLPAVNINYAQHMISDICNSPQLVKGVYEVDDGSDTVKVYTMLSGLGLPAPRINALKEDAKKQMEMGREKEKTRTAHMTVDYGGGNETKTKAEEINRMIKQKRSGFGQLTSNANNNIDRKVKDRRKR